jgi:tetratricopeptide (TPR) repeat protein
MLAALALAVLAADPPPGAGVPEAARARYQDAVTRLSQKKYGPANDLLNTLASEFPRVAEVFASRCSAQLGLQHWAAAEADCSYTLKLKQLPTALYGLAVAEDGLGHYADAITHYRQYAALTDASPDLKKQAQSRAELLAAQPAPAATQPAAAAPPPGGAKGQFVPGIPDSNEGLLYVYRNLLPGIGTGTTLWVDNKRVGELWNDHYFEVRLKPGPHNVTIKAAVDAGKREPEHSLPVEIAEGGVSYLKLEYWAREGDVGFKLVSIGKEGRKEIRDDCELVYSKKL